IYYCIMRYNCITIFILGFSSVHQDRCFLTVAVGDEVTLRCYYKDAITSLYWFKQSVGQKPRRMTSTYPYQTKEKSAFTFYNDFNNTRFRFQTTKNETSLKITDLKLSDSATYFCASLHSFTVEFSDGCTVFVTSSDSNGSNIKPIVYQSASKAVQPGSSETVECRVHTGSCDTDHSIYWFQSSDGSHPGFTYAHGDVTGFCEKTTNTCVYSLPVHDLTQSNAGTLYCAVASCGRMLLGNGTKLVLEDEKNWPVLILCSALVFTTIYSLVITFLLCKMRKRSSSLSSGLKFFTTYNSNQEDENISYAALHINKKEISRRQRSTTKKQNETIYSNVKE
uniref:Uncharacterized LOC114480604 n=1 Tax=Gouania willdenowi TaxID=441366 RepID=A0A8C5HIY1_GOUWI